jgi:hypothetical protein
VPSRGIVCRVELGPSRSLVFALATGHVTAGAAMLPLDMPWQIRLCLWVVIAASAVRTMAAEGLRRSSAAVVLVEFGTLGGCIVQQRNGLVTACQVLGSTFVAAGLVVLNLRGEGELWARHVVIVRDAVDDTSLRRLRVWLRWGDATRTPG